MKIAAAPISWGVSEVPGWGIQLPAERVLADVRELGIGAIEAGPPGFLPADPGAAREMLAACGLELVGGFLTAVLHEATRRDAELARIERHARWLAVAGARVLVLAAAGSGDGYDARTELREREWSEVFAALARAGEPVAAHGLRLAVHPHFGTAIETAADIERLLSGSDVALCLDTGHAALGGADPVVLARDHAPRVAHVHLKDVDPGLASEVRSRALAYAEGVRRGLYRPLGRGIGRVADVIDALHAGGYEGWYVLEQDRALAPGADTDLGADVRESLELLRAHA